MRPDSALLRGLRRIPEPRDYFAGLDAASPLVPRNVILFPRAALRRGGRMHHQRHVLILAFAGACGVVVDDAVFDLRPGHALLLFPFQFHGFLPPTPPQRLAWLFVTFEGAFNAPLAAFRHGPVPISRRAMTHAGVVVEAYLGSTFREHRANAVQLGAGLLLGELLLGAREEPATPAAAGDPLLARVCRLVHARLHEGLGIKGLAAEVGLSASHLRAAFRQAMGMPLGRYLAEVRILRAGSLLHSSDLRLARIAERCGYESESSLSRAFSRRMGLSPRQYRNRARS